MRQNLIFSGHLQIQKQLETSGSGYRQSNKIKWNINFSFSTHLSFPENGILMRTESGNRNEGHADSDRNFMQGTPIGTSSTTSTMPSSVQTTTPPSTSSVATPPFRETPTPKMFLNFAWKI